LTARAPLQVSSRHEELRMSAEPASVNTAAFAFVQELARDLSKGDLILPSFPDSVLRIRKALEDPNCSPDKLARIATADQVLAGRLLKMSNSALLQRGGTAVSDLRTAIFKLGFAMVRNAAISVAVQQMFHTKDLGALAPRIRDLWEESTKVAAASYVIARSLTRHNPDEAFLAGMLHNIGKVYIYTRAKTVAEIAADPQLLAHVQDAWHGPIGRSIIESWGFSTVQAAAAEGYRDFARHVEGSAPDLTDVVQVARIIAGHNPDEPLDFAAVPACVRLKLNEKNAAPIFAAANAEIQALAETLRGG
jgi:HD-like signal output (HDOD) protein